jgi:transcriptional regulator with XRE-family HTH domain
MSRKTPDAVLRRREELRQRVEWVLNHLFSGRQRRLADALGMSQSLISRVVNGQQGAGADLLTALARLPGVNPTWVAEGVGEPLLPPTKGTLPVAMGVLPGWPERYPELLTGDRHPVAEAYERPSRYYLPVVAGSLLCSRSDLALLPGDLLLFDANRELWANNLPNCKGRLFGARRRRGASSSYEVGRLGGDERALVLDFFDRIARIVVEPVAAERPAEPLSAEEKRARAEAFDEQLRRPKRKVRNLKKPRAGTSQPGVEARESPPPAGDTAPPKPESAEPSLTPEDLVAVRVYTVRPS